MSEITILDKNGSMKSAKIALTGKETAGDLLSILGLQPQEYVVQAGNSVLDMADVISLQGPVTIKPISLQPQFSTLQEPNNITVTLKLHDARTGVRAISHTFPATATPYDVAESLVTSVGGTNPDDIKIVSDGARNLMESQYRYKSLASLGVRNGQVLSIQGDIIQG